MFIQSVNILVFSLVALLIIGSTHAADGKNLASSHSRIVGGQLTTINHLPYLMQLRSASWNEFFCGGSLVSATHVITAAHCLEATDVSNMVVVGGATTISDKGVQRRILKAYPHPMYKFGVVGSAYDIAVLKLNGAMVGPNIQPIALCSQQMNVGDVLQVSGWGHVSEQIPKPSHQVRTMFVPTFSYNDCRQRYGTKIQSSMLCAGVLGQKDACQGDSGGPGVYRGQLCAVVSFGKGCARPGYPGVYTNILAVTQFLSQALRT